MELLQRALASLLFNLFSCITFVKFQLKSNLLIFYAVWECPLWKRHQIVQRIVDHVLAKHLSLSNEDVTQIVDQLDFSLLHGTHGNLLFSPFLTSPQWNSWLLSGFFYFIHAISRFNLIFWKFIRGF